MLFPASRRLALSPKWTRDILWRRARAVPSLDLRFAENKSLVNATTGQNLVTFTRASSGTYVDSQGVIRTATTNEARFDHNPTTGESLGLLVEEQRTNLFVRSEQFDDAAWNSAAGARSVTANSITAPDGTTTADLITADGTNAIHFVSQSVTVANIAYSCSVWAKANTGSIVIIRAFTALGAAQVSFNLSTGSVGSASGGIGSIQSFPNGWYRCAMVFTPTAATGGIGFYIDSTSAITSSNSIYLWGAQLEVGAFPTSYIPTTTATATRSADVASVTGSAFSSWYRQDEGTVFVNASAAVAASILPCYVSFDNGTTSERLQLRRVVSGTSPSYRVVASGQSIDSATKSIGSPAGFNSQILAYASNNYEGACNGVLEGLSSIANRPAATQAQIGTGAGSAILNGTIRRFTYWPQRLNNSTLQQITQ